MIKAITLTAIEASKVALMAVRKAENPVNTVRSGQYKNAENRQSSTKTANA